MTQTMDSHRRFNPLTGEWVLVSPQRASRPWQGKLEAPALVSLTRHDQSCYLCAGNQRANGSINPDYRDTFVFTNDFPPMTKQGQHPAQVQHPLLQSEAVTGTARVICFSPDHSLTLPLMSLEGIGKVVTCWIEQLDELSKDYQWVQIFENKGELMGCSNAHPHGQVWAQNLLPGLAELTGRNLLKYFTENKSNLLLDYAQLEIERNIRIVDINDDWVCLVPWWATWPFELLLIPLKPARHLNELSNTQRKGLACILKASLSRYDNLFQCRFPYSMGWHGQPWNGKENRHWQLHGHFYPPLLHSSKVKKFMVGYEMLAEAQRDITPEQAAEKLQACSPIHYLESG